MTEIQKNRLVWGIYGVAALIAIWLAFSFVPKLIGPWESYHIYNGFYGVKAQKVVMEIQRGANTAGHYGKHNYGLINLSAYIIRKLHFDLNLFNLRFISLVFGFLSLGLFFKITDRWIGRGGAYFATALLAVNETFLLFEHYLLPQMFTFFSILFLLERFQKLYESEEYRVCDSITFGLAAALCGMHYLLSRLLLIAIFALQFKFIFTGKNLLRLAPASRSLNFKKARHSWESYLLILGILNPENLLYTLHPTFIFSDLGEYATNSSGFLFNLAYNLPFMLKHVFHDLPFYKESLPFFILGDAKYHLMTWPLSMMALVGLIVSLRKILDYRFAILSYIFFVVFLIMNMSYVYEIFPDGTQNTTLSSFRTFYFCLPCYLLIAVFYEEVVSRFKTTVLFVAILFIPLFALGVSVNLRSFEKFQDFYSRQTFDFKEPAPKHDFTETELIQQTDMKKRILDTQDGIYHQNQVYLRKLAEKIGEKTHGPGPYLVHLPLKIFTPSHYRVCCGLAELPYLKIFLAVYLFDLDLAPVYLDESLRYRFQDGKVYLSTNEEELFKIKKDFPNIVQVSVVD